jgi:hypothetical protein
MQATSQSFSEREREREAPCKALHLRSPISSLHKRENISFPSEGQLAEKGTTTGRTKDTATLQLAGETKSTIAKAEKARPPIMENPLSVAMAQLKPPIHYKMAPSIRIWLST